MKRTHSFITIAALIVFISLTTFPRQAIAKGVIVTANGLSARCVISDVQKNIFGVWTNFNVKLTIFWKKTAHTSYDFANFSVCPFEESLYRASFKTQGSTGYGDGRLCVKWDGGGLYSGPSDNCVKYQDIPRKYNVPSPINFSLPIGTPNAEKVVGNAILKAIHEL